MYKYTKISEAHYISHQDGKMYTKGDIKMPNTIYYPPYLQAPEQNSVASFEFGNNDKLLTHQNYSECTDTVKLNQIWIQFDHNTDTALIKYYDYRTKKKYWVSLRTLLLQGSGSSVNIGVDVAFDNGGYRVLYSPEGNKWGRIRCCHQYELNLGDSGKVVFNVGLTANQYTVEYQDVVFGGTCYAFLCDSWVILLGDDLSIDAVAIIDGVKNNTISIRKFVWSTNPFIVQQVMLVGGVKK